MDDIVWSENERCALLMIIPWSPRGADVAISRVQSPTSKTRHYLKLASLSVPIEFPEKETRQGNIIDDAVIIQEDSVTHYASSETQSSAAQTYVGQGRDQKGCAVQC